MITSDRMSIVVPGLDSTAKVGALQNGLNHSFVNFFMMMHIMIMKPSSSSVEPESPLCKLAGLNSRPWSRRWCPFLPRWMPAGHRPWCPLEKAIMREQQWPIMIIIVIIIIKGVIRFTLSSNMSLDSPINIVIALRRKWRSCGCFCGWGIIVI